MLSCTSSRVRREKSDCVADAVAHVESKERALALERTAQRRANQPLGDERQIPLRLVLRDDRPRPIVAAIRDHEIRDQVVKADGEDA